MRKKPEHKLRQEIAQRAARLVALDDARDFLKAKRKAASQLGISEKKYLPGNIEIEMALAEYQQLFLGDSHRKLLQQLRTLTIGSMRTFRQFNPHLTGPVLAGTASPHSEITLHLFCDNQEEIMIHLINNAIPYESCVRRIRTRKNITASFPAYRFIAGKNPIVLIIFPVAQKHFFSLDPVDGKPIKRANEYELKSLIENTQAEPV